jgi:hypothetical protein
MEILGYPEPREDLEEIESPVVTNAAERSNTWAQNSIYWSKQHASHMLLIIMTTALFQWRGRNKQGVAGEE